MSTAHELQPLTKIQTHPLHRAALRRRLKEMREFAGRYNKGLHGYDEIAAYLNQIGVRNGLGREPTVRTVKNWIEKRGFPSCGLSNRQCFTTELHVLAWLWAYSIYRKTKPHRCKKVKTMGTEEKRA